VADEQTTREQFERAAELAGRDDPYSRRWSLIHEGMAEAVIACKIGGAEGLGVHLD